MKRQISILKTTSWALILWGLLDIGLILCFVVATLWGSTCWELIFISKKAAFFGAVLMALFALPKILTGILGGKKIDSERELILCEFSWFLSMVLELFFIAMEVKHAEWSIVTVLVFPSAKVLDTHLSCIIWCGMVILTLLLFFPSFWRKRQEFYDWLDEEEIEETEEEENLEKGFGEVAEQEGERTAAEQRESEL